MKAILLGTGNGKADPERFCPANVIWIDDDPVLIDCGAGALYRLREAGIHPGRVEAVLLTHLHFDHYSDLPFLAIQPLVGEGYFERGSLTVYGPPGTEHMVRNFEETYRPELESSYAYLDGYEEVKSMATSNVIEIHRRWSLERNGWSITTAQVDHGDVELPCFAYRVDSPTGESIVFSGDTVPCDGIVELASDADVLVHECTFPDEGVERRKQKGLASNTHSTPSRVAEVAKQIDVDTLVLNHLVGWKHGDESQPHDWDRIARPIIEEQFDGELIIGEDLMEISI